MRTVSSSRTRRSAASSAARADASRSAFSVRSFPADTWAARWRLPATMGGTRFSDWAFRPIAARFASLDSASIRSRFSRRTSCSAARSARRAAPCSASSQARHSRVRPAEDRQLVRIELGRIVHEIEQCGVVAHDDERAPPAAHHAVKAPSRIAVEVVGRLVEERDRGSTQPDPGDRGEHRLAARQLADPSVEHLGREPGLGERGVRAGLDVPVRADRVEMAGVDVAGLDRANRGEHRGRRRAARRPGGRRRASAAGEGTRHPSS